MAILLRGMERDELARWTAAMLASGNRLDLSSIDRPTVDKHSTGGVGDKVSLILCPLVAACGAAVPQMAGRGLGHTGGTLDKLEAIPGWRGTLAADELLRVLRDTGAVICAAGTDLVPADRKLYALRDVTATVPAIPLIASSIMSKKIAEGTSALVLDVKVGRGAFMADLASGRELAKTMVELGQAHGVHTSALLTDMNTPLGRSAGNALEVTESIEVLQGGGPPDLVEVTLALAREMLDLVGLDGTDPADLLADGRAMDAFDAMIRAQGGDAEAPLAQAAEVELLAAPASGTLSRLDALAVGEAAWRLGAGRARKEHPVSAAAGVVWRATVGEEVRAGEPLLELHADDAERIPAALEALTGGHRRHADPGCAGSIGARPRDLTGSNPSRPLATVGDMSLLPWNDPCRTVEPVECARDPAAPAPGLTAPSAPWSVDLLADQPVAPSRPGDTRLVVGAGLLAGGADSTLVTDDSWLLAGPGRLTVCGRTGATGWLGVAVGDPARPARRSVGVLAGAGEAMLVLVDALGEVQPIAHRSRPVQRPIRPTCEVAMVFERSVDGETLEVHGLVDGSQVASATVPTPDWSSVTTLQGRGVLLGPAGPALHHLAWSPS